MANTALRNIIRPKPASNEMFASWVNPIENGGGNGTERPNYARQKNTVQGPS